MKIANGQNLIKHSQLLIAGGIAFLVSIFLLRLSLLSALSILGLFSLTLFFAAPRWMIILLLVARSSFDIFTEVYVSLGSVALNIPSISGLFIISMGLFYLIAHKSLGKVLADRVAQFFLLWLGVLLFWIYVAGNNYGFEAAFLAARDWVRIFSLFIIYCLMYSLADKFTYQKVVNFCFLALIIPLIAAYYQLFTGTGFIIDKVQRIYGTFGHPNPFGSFLVIFVTLTVWKIKSNRRKMLWLILLVVELVALINVYAMGVMLMFVGAIGVFILLNVKRKQRLLFFLIIGIAMISFMVSKPGQKRIDEVKRGVNIEESIEGRGISNTLEWRIFRWSLLIEKWKRKPLLGYGLSTSNKMVLPYEWENAPHNDTLRFMVETGVVGLLFYLIFIIAVGVGLWRSFRVARWECPAFAGLLTVLVSIFFAWMIASTVGNPIEETAFQYYFWALLGTAMGSYHQQKLIAKHNANNLQNQEI